MPVVEEEDEGEPGEGGEKPKKKKPKKDPLLNKKAKSDPNAPPANRLPLPDLYAETTLHVEPCLNFLLHFSGGTLTSSKK